MVNLSSKRGNAGWYFAAAIVIILIIAASILIDQYAHPTGNPSVTPFASSAPSASPVQPAGSITITVYSGELSPSLYGFGNTSDTISSPGPSYTVKVGTTVTVDFTNVGAMAHNWALVTQKTDSSELYAFSNSYIQSAYNPVQPGGKGSTTFVASTPGTYYYICQVASHVSLGMWGYFTVIS